MTNAKITRIFSAMQSAKNGNFYLSALATTEGAASVLGTTTEQQCLVNIELKSLSDGIKSLMTEQPDGRFLGDKDNDLADPITVNFRSMREDISDDGTVRFWCNL
jgi:hypothetical protein